MTLKDVQAMSDDDIRIKIDRICGVAYRGQQDDSNNPHWRCRNGVRTSRRPDYPYDLNACHEMESAIPEDMTHQWLSTLYQIVLDDVPMTDKQHRTVLAATARQRCEAFVLTMGESK